MHHYINVYKRYFEFYGRATRSEFWYAILIHISIFVILGVGIEYILGSSLFSTFFSIYFLGSVIPFWALTVRRLHDSGKSGWMILVKFIPFIGSIWLLLLLASESEENNQYGPHPEKNKKAYTDLLDDESVIEN